MRLPNLKIIFATTKCRAIGYNEPVNNSYLPWKVRSDMVRFKKLTTGNIEQGLMNAVVMGRTTWDTLSEKFRPLQGRANFVFSGQEDFICLGATKVSNRQTIIDHATNNPHIDVWITGGSQIYDLFFDYASEIHWTLIDVSLPKDDNLVYLNGFYRLASSQFRVVSTENFVKSDTDQYDSQYIILRGLEKPPTSHFQEPYIGC